MINMTLGRAVFTCALLQPQYSRCTRIRQAESCYVYNTVTAIMSYLCRELIQFDLPLVGICLSPYKAGSTLFFSSLCSSSSCQSHSCMTPHMLAYSTMRTITAGRTSDASIAFLIGSPHFVSAFLSSYIAFAILILIAIESPMDAPLSISRGSPSRNRREQIQSLYVVSNQTRMWDGVQENGHCFIYTAATRSSKETKGTFPILKCVVCNEDGCPVSASVPTVTQTSLLLCKRPSRSERVSQTYRSENHSSPRIVLVLVRVQSYSIGGAKSSNGFGRRRQSSIVQAFVQLDRETGERAGATKWCFVYCTVRLQPRCST